MLSKEEAQRAAANLSKKTNFTWRVNEESGGVYFVTLEVKQKMQLGEFAAKLKKIGVNFGLKINEYQEGKYVHIRADILNQQDILALANNIFNYPILSNNVLVDAAKSLHDITQLNWFVSGNEVSVSYPIEQRAHLAKHELQVLLASKGFEFTPDFHSQLVASVKDGKQVRYDKATATISNPFEIVALGQLQAKQHAISEQIITPDKAAKLYAAVKKVGREQELSGLTNTTAPDKFARALSILGVAVKEIQFNGTNGYKVKTNEENFKKMDELLVPPQENVPLMRK